MKLFIIFTSIVLLSGCGRLDQYIAGWTGQGVQVCIDGVNYIQFTSGVSVKYDKNGNVSTCN